MAVNIIPDAESLLATPNIKPPVAYHYDDRPLSSYSASRFYSVPVPGSAESRFSRPDSSTDGLAI